MPHTGIPQLLAAVTALGLALASTGSAEAKGGGLYTQIGLGYSKFGGSSLITKKQSGTELAVAEGSTGCCPAGGLGFDLRLGLNLFGAAGIEGLVVGNAWDIGSDLGGGGFVGGGLNIYPLGIFALLDPEMSDFPISISLGGFYAYSIIGKSFAYTGSALGLNGMIEYFLADVVGIGARLIFSSPTYSNFVYTDYNNDLGRCLDSSGRHSTENAEVFKKGSRSCNGSGPDASFLAAELVLSFHLPLFD